MSKINPSLAVFMDGDDLRPDFSPGQQVGVVLHRAHKHNGSRGGVSAQIQIQIVDQLVDGTRTAGS